MFSVKPSPIHGHGLFATELIPAGTILGQLQGQWTAQDGPYVLWVDEQRGFEVTCDLRYVNHHADPNAAYMDDLTVVALRDITPGEEITHDYGGDDFEYETDQAA
ncbi:SET domain-containing protein [Planctomycetales bacterium ZRK34]|nr:SET domain-containing protein [Planctomycetales bacterium ZRK34]